MATLILSGSVGDGGKQGGKPHNDPSDVAKVVSRFVELGYTWVSDSTTGSEKEFIRTIKLFQSIYQGSGKADKGDGRVSPQGKTHKWLAALNAPGWVNMMGKWGAGWILTPDLDFKDKENCWTTTWMEERIRWAGFEYNFRAFYGITDPPLLWIRDCSPKKGGTAPGHKSHQTGLDIDIRLPLLPPHTKDWIKLNASNYTELFHREAALLQCEIIKERMETKYIFFNDPEFTKKRLTSYEPNHSNHFHVRIKPPERIDGISM